MINLLFLSYWGIDEGLTASTVFPHLEILTTKQNIRSITFCSVERTSNKIHYSGPKSSKIRHIPLFSKNIKLPILNKVNDFIIFPRQLRKICAENSIDVILARGAPAGSLAYNVHKKTGIKYYVESFEPHADYMLESGVWSRWNPKYIFEKYWEQKQKLTAEALITVSNNYKNVLLDECVPSNKVYVVPCCVELARFKFNHTSRSEIRNHLRVTIDETLGIYVGKFGGVYYNEDAFKLFKSAFDFWGQSFKLILLTPQAQSEISFLIKKYNIPEDRIYIKSIPHKEVPAYLSAADFAFSLHKKTKHSFAFSPIKNGEYWASGLPIMMAEGIGDDSDIVVNENAGVIFSFSPNTIIDGLSKMQSLFINKGRDYCNSHIHDVAKKHRNFSVVESVYSELFDQL
jgi:glycosyltransferase involved in cell wall biosynthesis